MQILSVEVRETPLQRTSNRVNQSAYANYAMALSALEMMRRMTGDYCYIVERDRLYWIERIDPSGKEVDWS